MTAPVPLPASTVVLLQDAGGELQVFMVRRHDALAFMGGAFVFPGGRVEASDREADASWCAGIQAGALRLAQCEADDAVAFHVAAVRELFEEAGVLLVRGGAGTGSRSGGQDANGPDGLIELRNQIAAGTIGFRAAIDQAGLRLDLDALVPCAHWITPPRMTRRFDTWFFAARMPADQHAAHDAGETVEGVWMAPATALARADGGEIDLPVPTRHTLHELARFRSVDAALDAFRGRRIECHAPL
jgi:8-oxo-dGTP pyrophosphatase MutT (NUDIX family)